MFQKVIHQQIDNHLPSVRLESIPGCGHALFAATLIKLGCAILSYLGKVVANDQTPKWPDPGYDMCLELIYHLFEPEKLSYSINPQFNGGLAHFALSAAPSANDYEFCNAIMVCKLVTNPETKRKEAHFFLVAIRDIEAGEPIIWFYGSDYFIELEKAMGSKCPQWLKVKQIYERSSYKKPATKAPMIQRKGRGRPKKNTN